jgi:putative FmdB family regulatory protein
MKVTGAWQNRDPPLPAVRVDQRTRSGMPKYEYDCPRCGTFADYRPLAEYDLPAACPGCGKESPRAVLNLPAMSAQPVTPRHSGRSQFSASGGHGAGCRCCGGKNFRIPRREWVGKLL